MKKFMVEHLQEDSRLALPNVYYTAEITLISKQRKNNGWYHGNSSKVE